MANKKNKYIGRSLNDYISEQSKKDPEFAFEWNKLQFARRLRHLREKQKLTQAELAARIHTTQSAIARLESGNVTPKIDILQKIADALNLQLRIDFKAKVRAV